MKKLKEITPAIFLVGMISCFLGARVYAYQIETLPDTAVEKDIVLGPGKIEVSLDPGQSVTKMIYYTNRTGRTVDFTVNVEDFKGSQDPNEGEIFLGDQKGPYSLKDYLHPDTWQFTLEQGQRIDLPVTISVPSDAEPGGLYGVVFANAQPPKLENTASGNQVTPTIGISTKLGCLFLVRVNGTAKEDGLLKSFSTKNRTVFFEQGPVNLQFLYQNNGNVHLDPYGAIEIKNSLGNKTGEIEIKPYFVMPDSERLSQVQWDRAWMFGRYTATLSLNRGYQDIVDTASYSFWVIPWKLLAAGLAGALLLGWFLVWILGHFELKRKQ